jgi:predicted RNA-binding protein with RPS1 domain
MKILKEHLDTAIEETLKKINNGLLAARESGVICLLPEFVDFQVEVIHTVNAIERTQIQSQGAGIDSERRTDAAAVDKDDGNTQQTSDDTEFVKNGGTVVDLKEYGAITDVVVDKTGTVEDLKEYGAITDVVVDKTGTVQDLKEYGAITDVVVDKTGTVQDLKEYGAITDVVVDKTGTVEDLKEYGAITDVVVDKTGTVQDLKEYGAITDVVVDKTGTVQDLKEYGAITDVVVDKTGTVEDLKEYGAITDVVVDRTGTVVDDRADNNSETTVTDEGTINNLTSYPKDHLVTTIMSETGESKVTTDNGETLNTYNLFDTNEKFSTKTTDTLAPTESKVEDDDGLLERTEVIDDPFSDVLETVVDSDDDQETQNHPSKVRGTAHPVIETKAIFSAARLSETTTRIYKEGVSGGITIA